MITWGFPIWLYLWLGGMAAGAFFVAFLTDHLGRHTERPLLRLAVYLGVPLATLGAAFLLIDLGQPLRFWHLLVTFRISSPMSIGTWLLILWLATAAWSAVVWYLQRRTQKISIRLTRITETLNWAGFFLSILFMAYTGVLLAASNSPMWASTVLLPALFVTSAASTGAAILIFSALITKRWKKYGKTIQRMVKADAIIIVFELVVLLVYMFWLPNSSVSGADDAMRHLTTGVLAARFWLGVVLLALMVPFALDVAHWGKELEAHKTVFGAAVASSACVIVGGLILRAVIVIGGQL